MQSKTIHKNIPWTETLDLKKSKELSKITNKPEQNIIVQKINLKLSTEYITSFHLT